MVADSHNTLKDRLRKKMQERNITLPKLSKLIGIPKDRMYKWYSEDTNPKVEDAEVLEKWIRGESMEKVPHETPEQVNSLSMRAIFDLVESNKILAQSNKSISDANLILAKEIQDRRSIERDPEEIPEGVQSKLTQILGYIAMVGSGTRWKSVEEATAVLSSAFVAPAKKDKVAGTQSGVRR